VGNAIKFTEQGEVVLRAALRGQTDDEFEIEFAVLDTGIGIAAEKQQTIFAPFSQADGSTTRRFGGTGLGLTISSQLVQLMGGRIEVHSQIDRGSTFHFSARFKKATSTSLITSPICPAELRGTSILIVDDNATNRKILAEMLQHWEACPTAVDCGSAALAEMARAAAAGEPYPIVLVDAVMPEMDGFTLVEQVRRQNSFAPPTIMMLTSADRKGDALRCRNLGMAAYLIKPIRSAELHSAIASCLSGDTTGTTALAATSSPALGHSPKPMPTPSLLRILLAEDNPVNQRVAMHLLEKEGHAITVVNNGEEALMAIDQQHFDLVLMDVQMPEIDGIEATRIIRSVEAVSGGRHLPIVAMTAHAMKGDRERCLEAGMDDYVSKPIQLDELQRALRAVATTVDISFDTKGEGGNSAYPFDRAAAVKRLGGDEVFLGEVMQLFLNDSPRRLREIRTALENSDLPLLHKGIHTLKGAIGYLDAGPALAAIRHLERVAAGGNRAASLAALTALESELKSLAMSVADLADGPIC
jgi:CheY-like chemotaxis protein/HPt (histidine-containing phosphotransfer) domain-containing protein